MDKHTLHNIAQNVTPERMVDLRVTAGVGTGAGATTIGMNAAELSQTLQLAATAGGIVVSLLTMVYVGLGIYQRYKAIKKGK